MSTTAAQLRSRLPRVSPRAAQAAVQRARLSVVPRVRSRAPRVPFVTLISVLLLGGVVGLLLFNTSMQQASFQATALERQASDLGARQEALELDLQDLREPARIAQAAQRQGMVIPGTAGVLDLGSGKVTGDAAPADGEALPITPPAPTRPDVLAPVQAPAQAPGQSRGEQGSQRQSESGDRGRDGRDGVPDRRR